jgi:hypothetical protein
MVAIAKAGTADRLRQLLASRGADATRELAAALSELNVTHGRLALLREMALDAPTLATRDAFGEMVVEALLARASQLIATAGTANNEEGTRELRRIYGFLAIDIGGAERLGPSGEPGLSSRAVARCAERMAKHLRGVHPRFEGAAAKARPMATALAQAHLALLELSGEAPAQRPVTADALGLRGAKRALYMDMGLLVLDGGGADDGRVSVFRTLLERFPALREPGVVAFETDMRALETRGPVLNMRTPLRPRDGSSGILAWHEDIEPGPIDPAVADLLVELSAHAVQRAFRARPELRAACERDARASGADPKRALGRPLDDSAESVLTAALALVALDAPRALALSLSRHRSGRHESIALYTDAIGVLFAQSASASRAPLAKEPGGHRVGALQAKQGSVELKPLRFTSVGQALAFEIGERRVEVVRNGSGLVTAIGMDRSGDSATPPGGAMAPFGKGLAAPTVTDAGAWRYQDRVFAKLLGLPHVGTPLGSSESGAVLRMVGAGTELDVIATPAPAADVDLACELTVDGREAGIVLRAALEEGGMRGLSLVVRPQPHGATARAFLGMRTGSGGETIVAGPVELARPVRLPVRFGVSGRAARAELGGSTLSATVPDELASGDVALRTSQGALLELANVRIAPKR